MEIQTIKKVTLYSNILMIITSVHHLYGAIIYNTPWRLHVLIISVPLIIVTAFLSNKLLKTKSERFSPIFWIYWLIVLFPSIVLIGIFEGFYNHLLKNILYFSSINKDTLLTMFPPPKYELPNDFLFEFTGIMQGVIVMVLIFYFIRLTITYIKIIFPFTTQEKSA